MSSPAPELARRPVLLGPDRGRLNPVGQYSLVVGVVAVVASVASMAATGTGNDPAEGPLTSGWMFFSRTLVIGGSLFILLLPAYVMTRAALGRVGRSLPTTAGIGSVIWIAWFLVLAVVGSLVSKVVLRTELTIPLVAVLAVAGATFGVLAAEGARTQPPGSVAWALAVLDALALLVVAIAMSGQWGAAT